ncbi:MAG: hypothetical protein LBN05_08780 [Oscillospiraceae bacterium]|jgi:hypothetical protein|nr:hypothetical protein [Oscillospiraceae bacterium]
MHRARVTQWIRRTVILLAAFALPYITFSALAPTPTPPPEPQYTLRAYAGELALFLEGDEEPIEQYDVPVDTLPDADRALLDAGITVTGDAALQELLEDYTS